MSWTGIKGSKGGSFLGRAGWLAKFIALAALVFSPALAPPSARAQAESPSAGPVDVDLQLVLAVDASGSVSFDRFELQKRGYVGAFRSAEVLNAIRSGAAGAIAVTMFQWTGPALQVHVVPWMVIRDAATAEAFAAAIEAAPRQLFGGGTSISGAIDYAMTLLPQPRFRPVRRVIDISGDGHNRNGRSVLAARDEAVRAGVTINGLPILALDLSLDRYFYDNVIGGPGAFVVAARDYDNFAEAVRRKLVLEIAESERSRKLARVR